MRTRAATALATIAPALLMAQAPPPAASTAAAPPAPSEIVAAAPAGDWVSIAPSDLLVMTLAPDAKGTPRRIVIQLMPPPFSQGWIGNIRKLAAAHWWDGTSVNRVQDNYVVQWGDATEKKALPRDLATVPESEYVNARAGFIERGGMAGGTLKNLLLPRNRVDHFHTFYRGFPFEAAASPDWVSAWPIHCYGMVGVGRNLSPDTGSGVELYTVIGQAPRHLDRNIALVGRVIEGIEHLSSLPRGTEALGFYKTAAERVPIMRVRLATELPAVEQPRFEYLSTESATFARYADARANRRDAFFNVPAGGADICNIPVPVRRAT